MRMRNITLVGFFTVLLAASFSARSPDREAARDPEVGGMGMLQDDPITISDGSPLTLHSRLPWVVHGPAEVGPADKLHSVTSVSVVVNGQQLGPFPFNKQQCEVDIIWGPVTLAVTTNPQGRALRVKTTLGTFAKDFVAKDQNTYESNTGQHFISRVTVKQNGSVRLDQPWPQSGTKEITIHYAP